MSKDTAYTTRRIQRKFINLKEKLLSLNRNSENLLELPLYVAVSQYLQQFKSCGN